MKRWALLTLALYLVCISILGVLIVYVFQEETDWLGFYFLWIVTLLFIVQAVLLFIPVRITRERPVGRRSVITSAIFGAFPMALMIGMIVYFSAIMIWGETTSSAFLDNWWFLSFLILTWIVWGFIFFKNYSSEDPKAFISYMTGWLLRGSILAVLVAIPSHIISRHRQECCAPFFTLSGIAAGISIALLSFGPGIFFLFARKIKEKKGGNRNSGSGDDGKQEQPDPIEA
ncbi:hypothetical protein ACFL7D_10410 [candidate division KSB1 bacterium]